MDDRHRPKNHHWYQCKCWPTNQSRMHIKEEYSLHDWDVQIQLWWQAKIKNPHPARWAFMYRTTVRQLHGSEKAGVRPRFSSVVCCCAFVSREKTAKQSPGIDRTASFGKCTPALQPKMYITSRESHVRYLCTWGSGYTARFAAGTCNATQLVASEQTSEAMAIAATETLRQCGS